MKLNDLKIDAAQAEVGAWIDKIPGLGDIRLKVRGLGNADFRRLRDGLIRALPPAFRDDPKEVDKINALLLAETVLLGWDNLDGETYSKERALEIISDPDCKVFLNGIVWAAETVSERHVASVEEDAKN